MLQKAIIRMLGGGNLLKNIIEVDPGSMSEAQLERLIQRESVKFLVGMIAGLVIILGGIALIFMGYAGSINWVVTGKDFSSKLENASPGVLVVIIGLAIIGLTRFVVRVKKSK